MLKPGSRRILATLLVLGMAACQHPGGRADTLQVVSLEPFVLDAASPSDRALCAEFSLDAAQVQAYFAHATRVDSLRFNDEAMILPCGVQGELLRDRQTYQWRIHPGGAAYLFNDSTDERYLCDEACCGRVPGVC